MEYLSHSRSLHLENCESVTHIPLARGQCVVMWKSFTQGRKLRRK